MGASHFFGPALAASRPPAFPRLQLSVVPATPAKLGLFRAFSRRTSPYAVERVPGSQARSSVGQRVEKLALGRVKLQLQRRLAEDVRRAAQARGEGADEGPQPG